MYKVVFFKVCHGLQNGALSEQFYHYLELPFVPFVGLTVVDDGVLGPVEQVRYAKRHDIFWCEVAPETRETKMTPDELFQQLSDESGWVRFTKEERPWFWRS